MALWGGGSYAVGKEAQRLTDSANEVMTQRYVELTTTTTRGNSEIFAAWVFLCRRRTRSNTRVEWNISRVALQRIRAARRCYVS